MFTYQTLVFYRGIPEKFSKETEIEFRRRAIRGREEAMAAGWQHMNEMTEVGHVAVWLRRQLTEDDL